MRSWVRTCVRRFWITVAAFLIPTAIVVQLGRSLLPGIDAHREVVADYFSQLIGADISVSHLQASWQGMRPELGVTDLVITNAEGIQILSARGAKLKVNILRSLFTWRFSTSQIELLGLKTDLVQDQEGIWSLRGVAPTVASPEDQQEAVIDDPLDIFLLGRRVYLADADIDVYFRQGHQTSISIPEVLLENHNQFHRLTTQINVQDKNTLKVVLEGWGDPRDPETFKGSGYIQLNEFPLEKVAAVVAGDYWTGLADGNWREGYTLNARVWLKTLANEGFIFNGKVDINGVDIDSAVAVPDRLEGLLGGHWNPKTGWQAGVSQAKLGWKDKQSPDFDLALVGGNGRPMEVASSRLSLKPWHQLATEVGLLPEGWLRKVMEALSPQGALTNLRVTLGRDLKQDFKLRANLEKVSVRDWRGAPALTEVDGYLQADTSGGLVDLDSREGFSMHYTTVYDKPMTYEAASGQIRWTLKPEKNAIYVNSGLLKLRSGEESAKGYMRFFTPWRKGSGKSDLTLFIGLENALAKNYERYVPRVLGDGLRNWLASSVKDGRIRQGGFVYRGGLGKNPQSRAVQLYLDVADATLAYHEDWPELTHLNGVITVNEVEVTGLVSSAKLYDSDVGSTFVAVTPNPMGKGSLLGVRGQVTGYAADGLRVLRESALRQHLGEALDNWVMVGPMRADLTLAIPLASEAPGSSQKVAVSLEGVDLQLTDLDLKFSNLSGLIRYDQIQGLHSDNLKAEFWDKSVAASIRSVANSGTLVDLRGRAEVVDITRWTKRPELRFMEGELAYVAQLVLPANEDEQTQALFTISSDLKGVAVNLPAPYGKPAAEERMLQVRVPLAGKSSSQSEVTEPSAHYTTYDIRYGDKLQALFQLEGNSLQRAAVDLSGDAQLPEGSELSVTGKVLYAELEQWREVLDRYQAFQVGFEQFLQADLALASQVKSNQVQSDQDLSSSDPSSQDLPNQGVSSQPVSSSGLEGSSEVEGNSPLAIPLVFDLDFEKLKAFGLEFDNSHFQGEREEQSWQIQGANNIFAGRLVLPDDANMPFDVWLDYLRLPEQSEQENDTEVGENTSTEKQTIDPRDLLAMDFKTNELKVGALDLGQWSFKLRPTEQGVVVSEFLGKLKGAAITGQEPESETGAKYYWTWKEGELESRFVGRMHASDIASVLTDLNQPKILESKNTIVNMDFVWPGGLSDLSTSTMSGLLTLKVEKGRFFENPGTASNGFLKLVGLFNFDTWARRLQLDFSDLLKGGMAFDSIRGEIVFDSGKALISAPVVVKTPSSKLQMAGSIDLRQEELDASLVATLPVGGNLTLVTALLAGLPAAAGVYVASKLFQDQVDKVASVSYRMQGSWNDPKVKFDKLFDPKAAKRAGEKVVDKNGDNALDKEQSTVDSTEQSMDEGSINQPLINQPSMKQTPSQSSSIKADSLKQPLAGQASSAAGSRQFVPSSNIF